MSSTNEGRQDIPFLLFLVPFAVPGLYAIYLWATTGLSATLPQSVFLQVTENPYVFLVGFVAVVIGASMDVMIEPQERRRAKLVHDSDNLQKIAIASLVLGVLSAWYAAGFDPGQAAVNILAGKYVVVFPALLIAFSFLMLPSVRFNRSQARNIIVILLFLAIPLSVDEIGKRSFYAGMTGGLVLLVVALYLLLEGQRARSV